MIGNQIRGERATGLNIKLRARKGIIIEKTTRTIPITSLYFAFI